MKIPKFKSFWWLTLILVLVVSYACSSQSDVIVTENIEENSESENDNEGETDDDTADEDVEEGDQAVQYYEGQQTSDRLSDDENRFYTKTIPNNISIAPLLGNCNSGDSDLLNDEITRLSASGGGIVRITTGTYCLSNIVLQSNVQLKIDADVVLQPNLANANANRRITMFFMGEDRYVENAAITNTYEDNTDKDSWFQVNIPQALPGGFRFVELGNVKNFKVSGFSLTDTFTKFSSITFNLPDSQNREETSSYGIVKDMIMENLHVGYGIVQIQTGKHILFKNLNGKGGITLRIETGAAAINNINVTTVDDLVARDITVRDGHAALALTPHRIDQGRVDAEGITAMNSAFAAQIQSGFADRTGTVDNLGTFDVRSYIGDIVVTGGDGAQIKSKDFKFFDCEAQKVLTETCKNADDESTAGKSIAPIKDSATPDSDCDPNKNGCYTVVVGPITKTNIDFAVENFFAYKNMFVNGCPQGTEPTNCN